MKKAVIVNLSDVFEYRVDMIYDCLNKNGWEVKVIASDFMHIEKKKRKIDKKDYIFINTIPYYKNISFLRLYSHYNFTQKAKKILKKMRFELLYIFVPANSLSILAKQYYKNTSTKIIIDIIDLWPESLPIKGTEKFPFIIWGNIRNQNLKYADSIITECDLYQKKLNKWLKNKNVRTVYWCHKKEKIEYKETLDVSKELTLCYLGSINNIIDIPYIVRCVKELMLERFVVIKIIGGGEKEKELLYQLEKTGARVIRYGKIYDFYIKKKIIDTCHFGINIMKDTVNIGLSMKCIDYFEMGLPVINNLHGDLEWIINKFNCGINIFENKKILYNPIMRKNARGVYEKFFCKEAFEKKMEEIILELDINML